MLKRKTIMFNIPNTTLQSSVDYCNARTMECNAAHAVIELGNDALVATREQFIIVPLNSKTHNIAVLYEVVG